MALDGQDPHRHIDEESIDCICELKKYPDKQADELTEQNPVLLDVSETWCILVETLNGCRCLLANA